MHGLKANHLPLVSCTMPTYGRPEFLGESVRMFLLQDYPRKELILCNDCPEQTFECDLPGVRVINRTARFPTLGEKRNACIEAADGDLIAIWDDDDLYLPWRLRQAVQEMQQRRTPFYRPSTFWAYWGTPDLHVNHVVPDWISHPLVVMEKQLWRDVGGYAARDCGEDAELFLRIHAHLQQPWIHYPVASHKRSTVLRGSSQYRHMSIPGGSGSLDLAPRHEQIIASEIRDPVLRDVFQRLTRHGNAPFQLSVCISLKNRSHLEAPGKSLQPFPRCVEALSQAARSIGPIELVVADFHSDDWPLEHWIDRWMHSSFVIRVVPVEGPFSRGRGLNHAVRAVNGDRLFLCDADILVSADALQRGIECLDERRVSVPICRYLTPQGTDDFWQELGKGLVFVERSLFEQCGGVPEFQSWGGEDEILYERLCQASETPVQREREPGLRHQWHPDSLRHAYYKRQPQSEHFSYHATRRRENSSLRDQPSVVFDAQHVYWRGGEQSLVLNSDGTMERPGFDRGRYMWERGQILRLIWDEWPEEVLYWNTVTGRYEDRTKAFTLFERRGELGDDRQAEGGANAADGVGSDRVNWEYRFRCDHQLPLLSRAETQSITDQLRADCAPLTQFLHSLGPFQFFVCGGNWGDALIRSGTLRYFRMTGLRFQLLQRPEECRSDLPAVLGGSGGFCRFWSESPRIAVELASVVKHLTVLPSTYERSSVAPLVACLSSGHRLVLSCREQASFRELNDSLGGRCRLLLAPDLAVWNELPTTVSDGLGEETTLWAFRQDAESLGFFRYVSNNRDVSSEHTADGETHRFFQVLGDYQSLHTDRLHVALAGAMLGRRVHFYPNAYHKNESAYRTYFCRYPNVCWHGASEGTPGP